MDPSKIVAVKNWKRQGRERDNRNAAWLGLTNGKEGRWRVVHEDFKMGNLARLYTNEIVTRHGVHVSIISDRGGRFTLQLCSKQLEIAERAMLAICVTFRIEVGDKVMFEVSSWKDVVHFGKKDMLAPRYVGPFVKYLADTNLHVHLEEIKVDSLRFVEEPIEIIDREVKSLKRSRILIVKSIGTRREVMRIS
ncbi:hypothetical protein Tco_1174939 [Tanacetum coccineum]